MNNLHSFSPKIPRISLFLLFVWYSRLAYRVHPRPLKVNRGFLFPRICTLLCQNLHQHAVECFLIYVRISDGAGVKTRYRFQCTVSVCTAVLHLVVTMWLSLLYTQRSDCKQNLFYLCIQACDFACGFVWVFCLGLSRWGRNVGWCCSRTRELLRMFMPKKDEVTGEWGRLRWGADKSLARPSSRLS